YLAVPDPFAEQPQLIYENIPLAAQILYRVRTTMPKPVLAKLGVFRTPRVLHETATKLASWASGFVMTHGVRRRVVDEEGTAALGSAPAKPWRSSISVLTARRARQGFVDLERERAELGRRARGRRARARQRDVDDARHAPRPRRHHHHAVGQEHRLGDRVRDE